MFEILLLDFGEDLVFLFVYKVVVIMVLDFLGFLDELLKFYEDFFLGCGG